MTDKKPDFVDIQNWSWRRRNDAGTVEDAARHFKVPAKTIVDIVREDGGSPYFYIVGDGPAAADLHFEHDGE